MVYATQRQAAAGTSFGVATQPPADGRRAGAAYGEPATCGTENPWLRHGLALVVGGGVFAASTYGLVQAGRRRVDAVAPDPTVWIGRARALYDACYNGCNDCNDEKFAYKRCERTVTLRADTPCSYHDIWFWAERHPPSCLAALGEILADEARASARERARRHLGFIVLTFAAGLVTYLITYKLLSCWASRRGAEVGCCTGAEP